MLVMQSGPNKVKSKIKHLLKHVTTLPTTDRSQVPLEESESGVPYGDVPITLSKGLGFSRQSLVVGMRGIASGTFEYICTATNNNEDASASIQVTLEIPGSLTKCYHKHLLVSLSCTHSSERSYCVELRSIFNQWQFGAHTV